MVPDARAATVAPSRTAGPSGPSELPVPSVATAAAACDKAPANVVFDGGLSKSGVMHLNSPTPNPPSAGMDA